MHILRASQLPVYSVLMQLEGVAVREGRLAAPAREGGTGGGGREGGREGGRDEGT